MTSTPKNTPSHFDMVRIMDFLATAKTNGVSGLGAKLPQRHPLIWTGGVRQIRGNRALAEGWDELGNLVQLGIDGKVRQFLPSETKGMKF